MNLERIYFCFMIIIFLTATVLGCLNAHSFSWDKSKCFVEVPRSEISLIFKINGENFILLKIHQNGLNFLPDSCSSQGNIFKVYGLKPGVEIDYDNFESVLVGSFQGAYVDDMGRFKNVPTTDMHIIDRSIPIDKWGGLFEHEVSIFDIYTIMDIGIPSYTFKFNDELSSRLNAKYALETRWLSVEQRTQFINGFLRVAFVEHVPALLASRVLTRNGDPYMINDFIVPYHESQRFEIVDSLYVFETILKQSLFDLMTYYDHEKGFRILNIFQRFLSRTGILFSSLTRRTGILFSTLTSNQILLVSVIQNHFFTLLYQFPHSLNDYNLEDFRDFGFELYKQYRLWGKEGLGEQFRVLIRSTLLIANSFDISTTILHHSEINDFLSVENFDLVCDRLLVRFNSISDWSVLTIEAPNDVRLPLTEVVRPSNRPIHVFDEIVEPFDEIIRPFEIIEPFDEVISVNEPKIDYKPVKVGVAVTLAHFVTNLGFVFSPSWSWTNSRTINSKINFKN